MATKTLANSTLAGRLFGLAVLFAGCQSLVGIGDYREAGSVGAGAGGNGGSGGTGTGGPGTGGAAGGSGGSGGSGGASVCADGWASPQPLQAANVRLSTLLGQGGNGVRVGGVAITADATVVVGAYENGGQPAATAFTYRDHANTLQDIGGTADADEGCMALQLDAVDLSLQRQWFSAEHEQSEDSSCHINAVVADGLNFWLLGDAVNTDLVSGGPPGLLVATLSDEIAGSRGGFAFEFGANGPSHERGWRLAGEGDERVNDIVLLPAGSYVLGDHTLAACIVQSDATMLPASPFTDCATNCPSGQTCLFSDHNGPGATRPFSYAGDGYSSGVAAASFENSVLVAGNRDVAPGADKATLLSFSVANPVEHYLGADNVLLEDVAMNATDDFAVGSFAGTELTHSADNDGTFTPIGPNPFTNQAGFLFRTQRRFLNPSVVTFASPKSDSSATAVAATDTHLAIGLRTSLPVTVTYGGTSKEIMGDTNQGALLLVIGAASGCVRYEWLGDGTTIDALDIRDDDLAVAGTFTSSVDILGTVRTPVEENRDVYVGLLSL